MLYPQQGWISGGRSAPLTALPKASLACCLRVLPDDHIHDGAVAHQPHNAHNGVDNHNGDLDAQRQKAVPRAVVEPVTGEKAQVQHGGVVQQLSQVRVFQNVGREERVHPETPACAKDLGHQRDSFKIH